MTMSVLINAFLLFCTLGWAINCAVTQVKHGLDKHFWLNTVLLAVGCWVLAVRLTP